MMLFTDLSHEELLAEVSRLAMRERQATAALIRCLMEVDARRLYLAEGYSSLFTFCTQVLHLSEHAALGRIEVARAARRLPTLLAHLEDGSVTVTNARMLAPHMTEANCEELLARARHREVEEIVARLRPQPDVHSTVRELPSPRAIEQPLPPMLTASVPDPGVNEVRRSNASPVIAAVPVSARPPVTPLAPERYKIQFTASREMHEKLRYAQNLLRHVVPTGEVAVVFDRALSALIEQLEKQKCGAASRPRWLREGARGSDSRKGARRGHIGSRAQCGQPAASCRKPHRRRIDPRRRCFVASARTALLPNRLLAVARQTPADAATVSPPPEVWFSGRRPRCRGPDVTSPRVADLTKSCL